MLWYPPPPAALIVVVVVVVWCSYPPVLTASLPKGHIASCASLTCANAKGIPTTVQAAISPATRCTTSNTTERGRKRTLPKRVTQPVAGLE